MAITNNCIIKSVNLAAGESFVLPPGSKLVGASNQSVLTSTCDIPPLEEIGCYIAAIGSHDYSVEAFSYQNRIWFRGYRLNGVDTLFDSEIQDYVNEECMNLSAVGDRLIDANIGIIFKNQSTANIDGTDRTCISMLLIQTVPSVANNLELLVRMNAEDTGNYTETFPRIPFIPYANYPNQFKPVCPGVIINP